MNTYELKDLDRKKLSIINRMAKAGLIKATIQVDLDLSQLLKATENDDTKSSK